MDMLGLEAAGFADSRMLTLAIAAGVFLISAIIGLALSRRGKKRAGSNARAASSFIMGLTAVAEGTLFGVIGSPFGIILGFAAMMSAKAHGKHSKYGRSKLSSAGLILGVIGFFASLFELGTVTVALTLFG